MSGHTPWEQIRHKRRLRDAARKRKARKLPAASRRQRKPKPSR